MSHFINELLFCNHYFLPFKKKLNKSDFIQHLGFVLLFDDTNYKVCCTYSTILKFLGYNRTNKIYDILPLTFSNASHVVALDSIPKFCDHLLCSCNRVLTNVHKTATQLNFILSSKIFTPFRCSFVNHLQSVMYVHLSLLENALELELNDCMTKIQNTIYNRYDQNNTMQNIQMQ